jgi:hypothetical protein
MSEDLLIEDKTHFKGLLFEGSLDQGLLLSKNSISKIAISLSSNWNPTKEVHLENLGIFPLPEGQVSLLQKQYNYGNPRQILRVPNLCINSHIPIYASKNYVFIPPLGFPACRYFGEIWAEPSENAEELEILLAGFLTLSSFIS